MQKSNSQPEDEDSDIADWDDWQDSANAPTKSLFDETVLDDPLKAIAYDTRKHAFNLIKFCETLGTL